MLLVTERNFKKALRGKDVDGESAVPQRYTEAKRLLMLEIDLAALDGNFQDAIKGGLRNCFRIQQADPLFFDGEFTQASAFQVHHDDQLLGSAQGDAKFGIFHFAERVEERIDTDNETILLEAVAQLAQVENASVHSTTAAFR